MFGATNASPSSSPNPPYLNYAYQLPTSPHYNIQPQHSPNPLPGQDALHASLQAANINLMDLDAMTVQQAQPVPHDDNGLGDFRNILPLNDSNLHLIETHLFSNLSALSLQDDDEPPKENNVQQAEAESMSTSNINLPPELPVIDFSNMLSSADLDGAFGRATNSNNL